MLGSFEVRTDDGVLADVPGVRLRGLLIALALEPGHAVPKATLVDWIWGERPPSDAANALQRLVSRLRKAPATVTVAAMGPGVANAGMTTPWSLVLDLLAGGSADPASEAIARGVTRAS